MLAVSHRQQQHISHSTAAGHHTTRRRDTGNGENNSSASIILVRLLQRRNGISMARRVRAVTLLPCDAKGRATGAGRRPGSTISAARMTVATQHNPSSSSLVARLSASRRRAVTSLVIRPLFTSHAGPSAHAFHQVEADIIYSSLSSLRLYPLAQTTIPIFPIVIPCKFPLLK